MWNPFRTQTQTREPEPKPEKREAYTDAVIQTILANASGGPVAAAHSAGAVSLAVGFLSRAFASAKVSGVGSSLLSPTILSDMVRSMCLRGEAVYLVESDRLVLCSSADVSGQKADPKTWRYRLSVPVPDGQRAFTAPGREVVHVKYSVEDERPWKGVGPLQTTPDAAVALAGLEQSLAREMQTPVGYLVPMPGDADEDSFTALTKDIKALKGGIALVETVAAGFDSGRAAAPQQDWIPRRLGPNPPESLAFMHDRLQRTVLAQFGVPTEIVSSTEASAGREGWRRFLHGSVQPLASVIAQEMEKIDRPVVFNFDALFASDLSGRARAFQSMVGGGMSLEKAAALAGLMQAEEN